MPRSRRNFLSALGAATAAGALATPVRAHDLRAIAPEPEPQQSNSWDMSWVGKITGKHRAVFDSPEISDGAGIVRAAAWWDMYKEVYGVERADISNVLVLRHSAIDLIMNNFHWAKYDVGKENKLKGQDKKWRTTNPISAGDKPTTDPSTRYTVETYLANGGIVLACGWAFRSVISRIQQKDKLDAAAARAEATKQMIPGIILQPNGIFAALRAQEAGCHYVMAS